MGADDRIENKTQDLTGRAKEAAGDLTNNDSLKSEGSADQGKAKAKDKIDDVADKAGDLKDKAKDHI
jgi:uncharacterized protein YjbJ (UPF0337 family)